MITVEQLRRIMPLSGGRAAIFVDPINSAMSEFEIYTAKRQAAFIAQIAHESGSLRYVREIASGAAYDTGASSARLGNTPEKDGDGQKYKGRGLIQITGRANYLTASVGLFGDERLLQDPAMLEETTEACRSAAWFWKTHGLNDLADAGDFIRITRRINGGLNGLAERQNFWEEAKEVLA